MTKEQKFYEALQDVFIGAKIEGQGGFVNLMKIKSNYYHKIEGILKKDVEKALGQYPSFRDELFDKLYSFFSRYFTESGSIYFNSTPFHNNIYEKVYTDEKDVILFWKTQMLYYVKTDRIFRSLPVEFDGFKFYFDASKIESKKANEKRSLVFELDKVEEDQTIIFTVLYSEKGTKTKQDEILKAIKKKGITITEEQLERAFRVFEKQSEVDFFINKNAKAFLREQFKLWSYQYFWEGAKEWGPDRVNQLQILKAIAFKIIDFISQFEDELVKIWNKPKFVKNSNYVITLDRIVDKKLVEKIKRHKNYKEQVKEWKELGIDQDNSKAPIDTKYFKDLEIEILSQFDDLDQSLDGWLIKSENYQALNTILPKFKEKVQTIYIDPPFNTGNDFPYIDRFQDSSWLSLMSNRVEIAKNLLYKKGGLFLHLDWNANFLGRLLLDNILGEENFRNEIVWAYTGAGTTPGQFPRKHDNILWFSKSEDILFNSEDLRVPYKKSSASAGKTSFTGKADEETLRKLDERGKLIEDWWSDIGTIGYAHSQILGFETQKPERLLQRIIISNSNKDDFIMDFFLGSGTTTAVAHKLGRKWLGVEMGEHFYSVILPRMKNVLAYDKSGISKEVNEYQGGGFFKYYELEQYEEALANCKYEDSDLFNSPSKTPYQEYVFMKDEKMLNALEIDYEEEKVKVDLNKLYSDIDIAETLSNLTGKWIKKINDGEVEFEDGMKINTKDLDYKLIKPLIWWE
jgi:adenine specific DNA methylase Mod